MRCQDLKSPHTYQLDRGGEHRAAGVDYLAVTGVDNITRPGSVEKWEASPDLKTWTLRLAQTSSGTTGGQFTADDAVWNLKRVLDPKTGSSVVGLMKGFILEEYETGEKDDKGNPKKSTRLWDANAIQKVDDFTVRLNGRTPQLAVPESALPLPAPDAGSRPRTASSRSARTAPAPSSWSRTGRRKQVFKAKDYWGGGPYLDTLEYIDLGDDRRRRSRRWPASRSTASTWATIIQLDALKKLPHLQLYQVTTA